MSSTDALERAAEAASPSPPSQSVEAVSTSRWSRALRFLKFAAVGGSGVVVNMAIFHLCYQLLFSGLSSTPRHSISNAVGVLVSIFTNFLLNDSWTWGDRLKGARRQWFKRLGRYYLMCAAAGLVQLGVAHLANAYLFEALTLNLRILEFDLAPSLAVGLGIVAGIAINFPISHLWAFKDEG